MGAVGSPRLRAASTAKVWVICGPTCSGKSECGRYLSSKGADWHEASVAMRADVPLELPPWERFRRIEALFASKGRDYVARYLIEHALARYCCQPCDRHLPIVVTGFRTVEEVACLRQQFHMRVIAVHAPIEMRYRWSTERTRADGLGSMEDFVRATAWEYGLGLARLIYEADSIVINSSSLDALQQAISEVILDE